jgi:threonylcarbamoyladenosine tRNA methylthiotransferase MtaB
MKTVKFYTLGCKVNLYETEAMRGLFEKKGYTSTESDDADVYVVNTCAVTAVGDKKSRQLIRRAKRQNPRAVVAVVGCYAQVSPDEVRGIEGADIILGTTDRAKIVELVERFDGGRIDAVRDKITAEYEDFPAPRQSRTRAVMKIQDGCANFCAYCVIPYARGGIRSRPLQSVIDEARTLAEKGFTEVVLAGIHLSSYGKGGGPSLPDAVKGVCGIEGIRRVRLSSLEPTVFTGEFVAEIASLPALCPAFHISLQSGCDGTLRRMNRKYNAEEYLRALSVLRAAIPGCAISTDIMVGFPGESDAEFEESRATVRAARFADLHVFQYSRRKGTPAAKMDNQVEAAVKAERSRDMIAVGKELRRQYCAGFAGKTAEVLFERKTGVYAEGLTEHYIRVLAKGGEIGRYADVTLAEYADGCFTGTIGGEKC